MLPWPRTLPLSMLALASSLSLHVGPGRGGLDRAGMVRVHEGGGLEGCLGAWAAGAAGAIRLAAQQPAPPAQRLGLGRCGDRRAARRARLRGGLHHAGTGAGLGVEMMGVGLATFLVSAAGVAAAWGEERAGSLGVQQRAVSLPWSAYAQQNG